MKNLKVWQKLVLMGTVFMIPFAVVTYKMVSSINTLGVQFAQQELLGLQYYRPLLGLLKDLQQRRALTLAAANGDAEARDALPGNGAALDQDFKAVDEADHTLDAALHVSKDWTPLGIAYRDLLIHSGSLSTEENFQRYTKLIGDVLHLIAEVGDTSNLTLDPDVDSYYLMNVVIFQAPQLSEFVGQAGAPLAKGPQEFADRLTSASILADHLQRDVDESLGKALAFNTALKSQLDAYTSAPETAASAIHKLATTRRSDLHGADVHASVLAGLSSLYAMEQRTAEALDVLLHKRIDKLRADMLATLGWAALGLLVVTLIGVFIMRDITVALRRVVDIANRISVGDLEVGTVGVARRDEIGLLGEAFSRMVAHLKAMAATAEHIAAGDLAVHVQPQSERDVMGKALASMVQGLASLVSQVQRSGIQVNSSLTQIAATAKQQQATATEVAATTSEIGATSRQISATSKELVRTMHEVSTVAEQSAALAGSGQTSLAHMERSMRNVMDAAATINGRLGVLNEKAGNITQVVTTITKVADQTNLLSLNAAIEAEKAGEYGRGFSVVATEIRRLADQTAVATYDIEQTIKEIQSAVTAGVMGMDKFSDEVRRGVQDVQQVSAQLSQIIEQVQTLAPRFDVVNEGMEAQSSGAEQISDALSQLSEAAQQTVESLRQSSQAIDGLNHVSSALRSGISRFTLEP